MSCSQPAGGCSDVMWVQDVVLVLLLSRLLVDISSSLQKNR